MNPLELAAQAAEATRRADANGDGHRTDGHGSAPFRNEPLTDFSQEADRAGDAPALADVEPQLGGRYPLVIGGQAVETGAVDRIGTIPSHRTQVVGRCGQATPEHADAADRRGEGGVPRLARHAAERRAGCCFDAGRACVRRRRFELAAWEVYETRQAVARGRRRRRRGDRLLRVLRPRDAPPGRAAAARRARRGERDFYEPRGVAVVIAPWNFPLAILCGMTTAALVTGNTVVMKPAEQSSVVAAKLMEVFEEAGFPPGVVNYLPGVGEEIGPTLVEHPDVALDRLHRLARRRPASFNSQAAEVPTGRTTSSASSPSWAARTPIIVDDDADLDEAVARRRRQRVRLRRARSAPPARGRSCWTASTTRSSTAWSKPRAA